MRRFFADAVQSVGELTRQPTPPVGASGHAYERPGEKASRYPRRLRNQQLGRDDEPTQHPLIHGFRLAIRLVKRP